MSSPSHQILTPAIDETFLLDEKLACERLLAQVQLDESQHKQITSLATQLIETCRRGSKSQSFFSAFIQEYGLECPEGVLLMSLAESLLRIPDRKTAELLIEDKLKQGNWKKHLSRSSFWGVNFSTLGLCVTEKGLGVIPRSMIHGAFKCMMHQLAHHFVVGETIENALTCIRGPGERFSFDMLGEAALTRRDAERFFHAYRKALVQIGKLPSSRKINMSLSIKLSALYPRYEYSKAEDVMRELVPQVLELAQEAFRQEVPMSIDAEEVGRLELSLAVLKAVFCDPRIAGWEGLGFVVQAYHKKAFALLSWLHTLAAEHQKCIPVRLVKGAYWDSEIKRAQVLGLEGYPVYTRKAATDLSYLLCSQKLLQSSDYLVPQFATHNAHTIASICVLAKGSPLVKGRFEFQRLHGMGEELYGALKILEDLPCRVYAPVGHYEELLPYLIRRLLENGANSSFVHHVMNDKIPVQSLVKNPVAEMQVGMTESSAIPVPLWLYGKTRQNSVGFDMTSASEVTFIMDGIKPYFDRRWQGMPIVNGERLTTRQALKVFSPAHREEPCGEIAFADLIHVEQALFSASNGWEAWNQTPIYRRAECLMQASDLLELRKFELIALLIREAGKTIMDAIDEVREAVDFCRYYAELAKGLAEPLNLPGPTGERNQLVWNGRGVFVCISPWNFPLAIFTGQIAAALVSGNTVIAKPAEHTSLMACLVTELFHKAGIPPQALHSLPGSGSLIGRALVSDARVAGVAFTGSTETAWAINQALAARKAPIVPLIAETGGVNAMIVDSSALTEQVVQDVMTSAFRSAGQRCSALRVLFLQEDCASRILSGLEGAMAELKVGAPEELGSDLGPVIDADAHGHLLNYIAKGKGTARFFYQTPLPPNLEGHFVPPTVFEIGRIEEIPGEVFGPILHVIRFRAGDLDHVLGSINRTGFGLTFGIHSRIEGRVEKIARQIQAGNVYVNRNMIGAVPGVQPFGGQGLSGTGPKAGGPHYLFRFATEKTITVNTAAIGGNVELLSRPG
ncbi:MAG: bifunctional proline dehydrogenase/L-glutamate gamma-semialdehyde dehydrogenase PutA [Gammaproteobacteria bacterium]|nr:bifunctional proline dehydrogenase/L-glutamate gamma-semialdehyde dehydrogenase PutA [Gammaproteobacteria bacterium]